MVSVTVSRVFCCAGEGSLRRRQPSRAGRKLIKPISLRSPEPPYLQLPVENILILMVDESKLQQLDYRRPPVERRKEPLDPESRRWRHRRILFRIGLFVALSPFTFYFGPNLFLFGRC